MLDFEIGITMLTLHSWEHELFHHIWLTSSKKVALSDEESCRSVLAGLTDWPLLFPCAKQSHQSSFLVRAIGRKSLYGLLLKAVFTSLLRQC